MGGRSPTHSQLNDFFGKRFPPHPKDVPLKYHTPRFRAYDPSRALVSYIVLSITPTPGVYEQLKSLSDLHPRKKPACFLHRPFGLDRRAVPRGVLVLACHQRFDELLTVGYNLALADALDTDSAGSVALQGYKTEPDRLMGLVARTRLTEPLESITDRVKGQFGGADLHADGIDPVQPVRAVALVNAFNAEMVERVSTAAYDQQWIMSQQDCSGILYVTGQARESGIAAARAVGMPVICVGHRAAEEWGIRWLATRLREQWPSLEVVEVFEDEEENLAAQETEKLPLVARRAEAR